MKSIRLDVTRITVAVFLVSAIAPGIRSQESDASDADVSTRHQAVERGLRFCAITVRRRMGLFPFKRGRD